jgi:hypothetical protein
MGECYWKVSDELKAEPGSEQMHALERHRLVLRDEYGTLRRLIWIVALEGPPVVAEAAQRLRKATRLPYVLLSEYPEDPGAARAGFNAAYGPFWAALQHFTEVARRTLDDL